MSPGAVTALPGHHCDTSQGKWGRTPVPARLGLHQRQKNPKSHRSKPDSSSRRMKGALRLTGEVSPNKHILEKTMRCGRADLTERFPSKLTHTMFPSRHFHSNPFHRQNTECNKGISSPLSFSPTQHSQLRVSMKPWVSPPTPISQGCPGGVVSLPWFHFDPVTPMSPPGSGKDRRAFPQQIKRHRNLAGWIYFRH